MGKSGKKKLNGYSRRKKKLKKKLNSPLARKKKVQWLVAEEKKTQREFSPRGPPRSLMVRPLLKEFLRLFLHARKVIKYLSIFQNATCNIPSNTMEQR